MPSLSRRSRRFSTADSRHEFTFDDFGSRSSDDMIMKELIVDAHEKDASTISWSHSPRSVMEDTANIAIPENSHITAQDQPRDGALLRVQVESSIQKTTFYVSVSLMLKRELEMQKAAETWGIPTDRWGSSRLFEMWNNSNMEKNDDELTIRIYPERSMKEYSSSLQWDPWLTSCVRAYYNTGSIRVPDACIGYELLLALEFFGILTTSPDLFVFENVCSYERVRAWSDYFSISEALTSWVVTKCGELIPQGGKVIWATSPTKDELLDERALLYVGDQLADVLRVTEPPYEDDESPHAIHDLFVDRESIDPISEGTPSRMREDFCRRLDSVLPDGSRVRFEMKQVSVSKASTGRVKLEERAVLEIQRPPFADSAILLPTGQINGLLPGRNCPMASKEDVPHNFSRSDISQISPWQHCQEKLKSRISTCPGNPISCEAPASKRASSSYQPTSVRVPKDADGALPSKIESFRLSFQTQLMSSSSSHSREAASFIGRRSTSHSDPSTQSRSRSISRPLESLRSSMLGSRSTLSSAKVRVPNSTSLSSKKSRDPYGVADERHLPSSLTSSSKGQSSQQWRSDGVASENSPDRDFLSDINGFAPVQFVTITSVCEMQSEENDISNVSYSYEDEFSLDAPALSTLNRLISASDSDRSVNPGKQTIGTESLPELEQMRTLLRKGAATLHTVNEDTDIELNSSIGQFTRQAPHHSRVCSYWDQWVTKICNAVSPRRIDDDSPGGILFHSDSIRHYQSKKLNCGLLGIGTDTDPSTLLGACSSHSRSATKLSDESALFCDATENLEGNSKMRGTLYCSGNSAVVGEEGIESASLSYRLMNISTASSALSSNPSRHGIGCIDKTLKNKGRGSNDPILPMSRHILRNDNSARYDESSSTTTSIVSLPRTIRTSQNKTSYSTTAFSSISNSTADSDLDSCQSTGTEQNRISAVSNYFEKMADQRQGAKGHQHTFADA